METKEKSTFLFRKKIVENEKKLLTGAWWSDIILDVSDKRHQQMR
ncbi:MAG: hypothetical protein ACLRTZ_00735 [Agathobacter sp.]|jgi:hypothetical protein